ncbi:MAG: adenylate kinase [Clostridia bacterium]|nr:adenylate kinase [Clostridia bacterium]
MGQSFPYKKVVVIGCCGAGKSTFSKQLAQISDLPLYHLDNIYWKPDQSHLKHRAFLKEQRKIMRTDRWIMDGNYGKTMMHRLKRCDIVYFFDLPTADCLQGVMKRDKKRNDIACELEPNEDFLNYIKSFQEKTRPAILLRFSKLPNLNIITFQSHEEIDRYLHSITI